MLNRIVLVLIAGLIAGIRPDAAVADLSVQVQFNIAAQQLSAALLKYSEQSGVQITSPGKLIEGKSSSGVVGKLPARDGLERLLKGTNLAYDVIDSNTILIRAIEPRTRTSAEYSLSGERNNGVLGIQLAQSESEDAQKVEITESSQNVDNQATDTSSGESVDLSGTQEVVVTGSRVATTPSQMAANVIVLNAQALQATGESKLEDALRQLPQNIFGASPVGAAVAGNINGAINITGASSINLRGLGNESTLILIDGRRIGKSGVFGGVSDISGIPLRSVERVEIMLDGASSVYGSDAVGGVVNIITRKDYAGVEASYQYGVPEKGGFDEHVVTVSGGTSWKNGRAWMMFEGYKHSDLDGADRPEIIKSTFAANPGSVDVNYARYQGQIYRVSVLVTMLGVDAYREQLADGSIELLSGSLPAGHHGLSVSASDLVFRPVYVGSSGDPYPNLSAERGTGISILPAQERTTFQAGFEQALPLPGEMALSGNLYYSKRDTYAAAGSFEFRGELPANDPRNLLGERTYIRWLIPDWADKHYETAQDVMRWGLALDGTIASRFRWQLSGGQSRDNVGSRYFNDAVAGNYFTPDVIALYEMFGIPIDTSYSQLYDAGLDILSGDILAANSPQMLAGLVVPQSNILALNRENTGEFRMDGALFSMPGGKAHMAVGMDWRQEMLRTASQRRIAGNQPFSGVVGAMGGDSLPYGAFDVTSIGRTQHAMFAEILLPLVGRENSMSMVRQLNLTGATRRDDYHGFDAASTWSAGLIWSPVNALNVRVNRSTSYVAPTFRDQLEQVSTFDNALYYAPEPGYALLVVDASGLPTGEVEYVGYTIYGGNPDLKPENADITSVGLEFAPVSLPGLTLRATWHHTKYRDRIGPPPVIEGLAYSPELGAQVIRAGDYETRYGSTFYRDTDGRFTWDVRSTNISRLEMAGIDYQARYDFGTAFGRFILGANVAYTSQYDIVQQAGDAPVNQVGDVLFQTHTVVPKYRYSAGAQWYLGGFWLSLGASTASTTTSTGDDGYGEIIQRTARYPLKMDFVLGFDTDQSKLSALPAWTQGMSVSLRIPRLLNNTTKYSVMNLTRNQTYALAEFNANVADPIGRVFYLNLAKRF